MKINIKGPIIPSNHQWIYDWLGMEATSPKKVIDQIENANGEELEIYINSGGGSVYDASEIYTALREYPGKTTGKIILAASAASFLAMGIDNLLISPTGQMMIHNAKTRAEGDYRDMDHTSDFLKKVNQSIANAYHSKSGKSYEELLSMMDDETWLTAQEAKKHNLVDGIMFDDDVQVVANVDDVGGLLPQQVIDKIRNELKNSQFQQPLNQTEVNKEDEELKTLEDLKNKYPDLYNQAVQEGIKQENARIKAIENLGSHNHQLVNKAKFETMLSPQDLAMELVMAENKAKSVYLASRNQDAAELDAVGGAYAPEGFESQENTAVSTLSSFMEQVRGGKK